MKVWVRAAIFVSGCLAVGLALSLLLLVSWLRAPQHHVVVAVQYLLVSGVVSLGLGVVGLFAASRYAPTLGIKIALAALFGSAAALINILVTPLLMFSERSDKYLLVITLLYFVTISVAFASIIAAFTSHQIRALHQGALELAGGNFESRVEVRGLDELADLSRAFNSMSSELGAAFERQRALERERRELLAAVSHDLRTPLASIRAMTEAINDGVVAQPDDVRRYMHSIQHESERLARLIDDLFELTRIENGTLALRLSSVPISELVAETVQGLLVQAQERNITLEFTSDHDLPVLALDGPRMQQVLVNLIQNALRHTQPGGRVRVAVQTQENRVMLVVTDTGEGIAPEDQPHVFELFYRGDKSRSRSEDGEGAGLGLAIARAIVEAHAGGIRVDSAPGKGARFEVTLPRNAGTGALTAG
ncbi:MAG: sensor histidine kinase [Chloroflexota bacterium]